MTRRSMRTFPFVLIALLLALVVSSMTFADRLQESGTNWNGVFYNSPDLSGAVVYTQVFPSGIDVNWGTGSPAAGIINNDNWSARFTSVQTFGAGIYEFAVSSDDGVRLYIDGVLVIDRFVPRVLATDRVSQTMTAGTHSLTVEYVEFTDQAALRVQWFLTSPGGTPGLTPGVGNVVLTPGVQQPTATRIPPTQPPPIPAGALSGTVIRATVLLVREAPYPGANVVGRVRRGETYQIVGRDEDARWYLIVTSQGQGWVWSYYIHVNGNEFNAPVSSPFVIQGNPASASGVVVQSQSGLRLRAAPTMDSAQIGRIPWGEIMPVLSRTGDGWYQVVFRGTTGWVASSFVDVVEGDINSVPVS